MRNRIFWCVVTVSLESGLLCTFAYAIDKSFESFVRESNLNSAKLTSEDNALKAVPNYSATSEAQAVNEFANLNDAELKSKGEQKKKDPHNAATIQMLERKPLDNFESHEMFQKADRIQQNIERDPAALLKTITSENCKEQINEAKNHYTKHVVSRRVQGIEYEEKTCELPVSNIGCKQVLHVTCSDVGNIECDAGGISGKIRQGEAHDVQFTHDGSVLTVGAVQRDIWGGHCAVYDRAIKFDITNPQDITLFSIFEVGYDDYLWIRINDHTVYVGPDGGNELRLTNVWLHTFVTNGLGLKRPCERKTNWFFSWLPEQGIDLKPYLKQGENTISMRVIVSGNGEGWMRIKARQRCCTKFEEEWVKTCWAN